MKVDFFIVGQPKSGTTALANFLSRHPEVCMSQIKEPGFFATDHIKESDEFHGKKRYYPIRTYAQYRSLFNHCKEGQITGEASTNYLYSHDAAKNIIERNNRAKIIIMLRNPIDFMYSLHMEYVNINNETELEFEEALNKEGVRTRGLEIPRNTYCPSFLFYLRRARYYSQVKRYINTFSRDKILIVFHEDFKKNNQKVYKNIIKFLGLSDFDIKFESIHTSKKPRFLFLNRIIRNPLLANTLYSILGRRLFIKFKLIGNRLLLKPARRLPLDPKLNNKLKRLLHNDVRKLGSLINVRLNEKWNI